MRSYHFKPRAQEDLWSLQPSDDDLEMIKVAVKKLAAGQKMGFAIPLQSAFLGAGELLMQYRVGRYRLNYALSKSELSVISVML